MENTTINWQRLSSARYHRDSNTLCWPLHRPSNPIAASSLLPPKCVITAWLPMEANKKAHPRLTVHKEQVITSTGQCWGCPWSNSTAALGEKWRGDEGHDEGWCWMELLDLHSLISHLKRMGGWSDGAETVWFDFVSWRSLYQTLVEALSLPLCPPLVWPVYVEIEFMYFSIHTI